jgi:uncharacterized protein YidB (DUF937 family)
VQQVLGEDQVAAVAQQAGIPAEAAGSQLAELLPTVVDRLTPNGQAPEAGTNLVSLGMNCCRV